jgi:hypothetical protein
VGRKGETNNQLSYREADEDAARKYSKYVLSPMPVSM